MDYFLAQIEDGYNNCIDVRGWVQGCLQDGRMFHLANNHFFAVLAVKQVVITRLVYNRLTLLGAVLENVISC